MLTLEQEVESEGGHFRARGEIACRHLRRRASGKRGQAHISCEQPRIQPIYEIQADFYPALF